MNLSEKEALGAASKTNLIAWALIVPGGIGWVFGGVGGGSEFEFNEK